MQHLCAVMLADGTVTFRSSHDEKRMREAKILELRGLIELRGDDALTQAMPARGHRRNQVERRAGVQAP